MTDVDVRNRQIAILLLEDSEIDAELLAAHLHKADLDFSLQRVVNRREFVAALEDGACDIILADFSLPDFDGLSALNIARALQPDIPFLFVSGVVGEEFATNALKRGATDYVMKRNLARLATAVERALGQARERDERRQAEAALLRSETQARLAVEGAQLGLWDLDATTGRLEWDERSRSLFGAPEPVRDLSYETFLSYCHPGDRKRVELAVRQAMAWSPEQSGVVSESFRIVAPGGVEKWLAMRGQAQFAAGECTRVVGVVRDITEERNAQEALTALTGNLEREVAARTAELNRIWRLSTDLFAVFDARGRFTRVNPAWRAMLGYEPKDLVGSNFNLIIHPDDVEAAAEVVRRLVDGESVERFDNRLRHADGSWRWMSWSGSSDGETFYTVGRDVTEERAAAEALAQRNADLAEQISEREQVEATLRQMQRLEAVGQLTSGVAHDFNNLLTVVLGNITFVERTLGKPADKRVVERLGHMRTAAERGAKLTAQLLAFSRRQKLEPKPIDLNETVASMRDLLQSTMGGSVRIETVLKRGVWPALVDPTQIELIILNLAINARDAMEVGGALTVETANVRLTEHPARPEDPAPGDYVVLSVSDTGAGMPPDVLAKAFEPFFTTKDVGKGSGLGLAQVYGFAKQSGGGVRIDTRLGEGTSVKVYLPKAKSAAVVEETIESVALPAAVSGQRVLVVDDDSAVREITAAMLRELGYVVVEAGSGGAALDVLRTEQPIALLLADYAMPGMNGAEAARMAQQIRPGLPVLFITGYADLAALKEIGEDKIIRKPFRDEELSRKVRAVLGAAPATEKVVPLRR